jgi:hypothetical protein
LNVEFEAKISEKLEQLDKKLVQIAIADAKVTQKTLQIR